MKKTCLLFALLVLFAVACGDDDTSKAPNLALAALTVSSGALAPVFAPGVMTYTVSVSNAVSNITVAATAADTNALVMFDPVQPVVLSVGSNLITVRVVRADLGATNSYRVVVIRAGSDNADLASLSVDAGSLIPAFDPAVTEYSVVYLSNWVATATLTASAAHGGAVVSYPGGQNPALSVGSNQLVVRVTAENGTNTRDYVIRVYRIGADYSSAAIGALKYVPAGSFQRDANAINVSFVSAFRMGRTEITRSQYSNVMGVDPGGPASLEISDPAHSINMYNAIAFCNKLSIREGLLPAYTVGGVDFTNLHHDAIPVTNDALWNAVSNNTGASGYRLPTEMEWMWAAMGAQIGGCPFVINATGRSKPFAGSSGANVVGDYAWYGDNCGGTMHPSGIKLPNELGLCDMSGNIGEMCWDFTGSYPSGYLSDYSGVVYSTQRILRGGGWGSSVGFCAISTRASYSPYERNYIFGFRVVRP